MGERLRHQDSNTGRDSLGVYPLADARETGEAPCIAASEESEGGWKNRGGEPGITRRFEVEAPTPVVPRAVLPGPTGGRSASQRGSGSPRGPYGLL